MISRGSFVQRLFSINHQNWSLMAFTSSTFSVGPEDSSFLLSNKWYNQILSCVISTSIDPKGGGGKYPFNNVAMSLRLWGFGSFSNDSNISCAGSNNKYKNGFQVFAPPHSILLHDDEESSTSSATMNSNTNNDPSNKGSSDGFFNQDLHGKIVVAVDVDEGT